MCQRPHRRHHSEMGGPKRLTGSSFHFEKKRLAFFFPFFVFREASKSTTVGVCGIYSPVGHCCLVSSSPASGSYAFEPVISSAIDEVAS
jgi:hypothetical protein